MNDRRDSAWKRLSLSTRLDLITASILLGTMAAFVGLDYAREREALLRAQAEQLATIAALTARTLPDRLSEITTEELRTVASARAEQSVSIRLVRDGRVVISSSERAMEMPALKKIDWSSDYDAWRTLTGLAVSVPYRSSATGPTGGTAELVVETSLASVNRTLSGTLRLHVIHGLATVLAMMLGVAWVLRRAVHGPFARMVSAMNVMARHVGGRRSPVVRRRGRRANDCFQPNGKKTDSNRPGVRARGEAVGARAAHDPTSPGPGLPPL